MSQRRIEKKVSAYNVGEQNSAWSACSSRSQQIKNKKKIEDTVTVFILSTITALSFFLLKYLRDTGTAQIRKTQLHLHIDIQKQQHILINHIKLRKPLQKRDCGQTKNKKSFRTAVLFFKTERMDLSLPSQSCRYRGVPTGIVLGNVTRAPI